MIDEVALNLNVTTLSVSLWPLVNLANQKIPDNIVLANPESENI